MDYTVEENCSKENLKEPRIDQILFFLEKFVSMCHN